MSLNFCSIQKVAVVFFLFCLGFLSPVYAAVPSSSIPLDSWIYPALEKLTGLGLINSSLRGGLPYSRLEAARQVQEATLSADTVSTLPVAHELLHRLESELKGSLDELRGLANNSGYIKPVRYADFDYIYRDGASSSYPEISARQFSLSFNNGGVSCADGSNGQIRLQGDARIGKYFQFDWAPLLSSSSGDSFDVTWQQLTAAVGIGAFELSVGRQSLWWGQGRHGSLVLTNNAKPFDMIRITNPSPILLPWFLKYLGPFHYDIFWARMEKDRAVSEPYFTGMRIGFKPLPWLEVGASRGIMFGGEGRPDVDWRDFLVILGGRNLVGDKDTSNSVAAIDACVRLPFLAGTEIYGEYGGEDESGHFLAASAWLAGIYFPKVEPSGRLSLRFEYADLSKIDNKAPPWYRHGIYKSGYTYDGRILGHHVGGAGEDLSFEAGLLLRSDLHLTLGVDYENRGIDQPVQEEHIQTSQTVDWYFSKNYSLAINLQYDHVENVEYHKDEDENSMLVSFGLHSRW